MTGCLLYAGRLSDRGYAQRAQTHCHAGHERTPDNIYVTPAGQWACKTCRRENSRRYREAQRCPS